MKRKGGPSAAKKADKGGSSKGGVSKHKKHKKQGSKQQFKDVPLPEEEQQRQQDASDVEISDEDVEFVQQYTQQLGFLKNLDAKALSKSVKDAQKRDIQKQQAAGIAPADGVVEEEREGSDDEDSAQHAKQHSVRGKAYDDDDEDETGLEAYERAPRVDKSALGGPKGRGLPVKTLEGAVMYDRREEEGGRGPRKGLTVLPRASEAPQVEGVTVEDELEASLKKRQEEAEQKAAAAAQEAAKQQAKTTKAAAEAALPPALAALRQLQDKEQRRGRAREAMAVSANKLLSGPEEAVGEFKVLLGLVTDSDMQVSRLAMLSLMAVFKDIVPGYRIRPPTEKELQVKVSKEVQKMRDYESALLKHYQTYLKHLVAAVKPPAQNKVHNNSNGQNSKHGDGAAHKHAAAHARVAVKCMCQLLTTLPHFNYASDLLQAVVPHMASNDSETRGLACTALHTLLSSHESHAKLALEAVQLVADLVRTKKCVCPAEVVQVLSVLRFTEIKPRSEDDQDAHKKNNKKDKGKKGHVKRARTEIDAEVDRDFKEADAGPDLKLAAMVQSQMLEALFETYFRVLKTCTSSPLLLNDPADIIQLTAQAAQNGVAPSAAQNGLGLQNGSSKHKSKHKGGVAGGGGMGEVAGAVAPGLGVARERVLARHPLLYAALEGLGRYAHLISVDYFADIMEVFHQLLRAPGLPLIERLRVLLTASNILRGQGEALNIDRRELYNQLYATLLMVPMHGTADVPPYPAAAVAALTQLEGQPARKAGVQQAAPHGGWEASEDEDVDHPCTAALAAVLQNVVSSGALLDQADQAEMHGNEESSATHRVEEPVAVLMGALLGQCVAHVTQPTQMLCEPKVTDMSRLAAYVKRGVAMASQSTTAEAITLLGCCMRLLRRYPRLQLMLEWEGEAPVAGRSWLRDCPDPSEAGALSSCLWELPLLALHYHPYIAQAAESILTTCSPTANASAQQLSGPLALPGTLRDLAAAYAPVATGSFHPGPAPPARRQHSNAVAKRLLHTPATIECEELLAEHGANLSAQQPSNTAVQGLGQDFADQGMDSDEDVDVSVLQDEDSLVAAGLQQQYRSIRRHELNQQLRREQTKLIRQIQKFQVHLHEQQQLQQQKRQAQKPQQVQPQAQSSQKRAAMRTGMEQQKGRDGTVSGKRAAASAGDKQAKQRRL